MNSSVTIKKSGYVLQCISRDILLSKIGDRLQTVEYYINTLNVSRGLVQLAIAKIEREEAASFSRRGTLGTIIEKIDFKKLWSMSGWHSIIGASPLPYTKRHGGLATGIYLCMEQNNIVFHFAYIQGAVNRAIALSSKQYNFAIMSKKSAMNLINEYDNLDMFLEFDKNSYTQGYSLVAQNKEILDKKNIRVGVDKDSPDQYELTKKLFKNKDITLVQIQYSKLLPAVKENIVDVTIFNTDVINDARVNEILYVKEIDNLSSHQRDNIAVIIFNKEEYALKRLLQNVLDANKIMDIQRDVISGKILPIY